MRAGSRSKLGAIVPESTDEIIDRQQGAAIAHQGSPARLLAGPGTGKTRSLTRRLIRLMTEEKVLPTDVLALTFTRGAAQELRDRVRRALSKESVPPRVSTLHSFALRQLLRNSKILSALPQPLRIADDWDEEEVIVPDLQTTLAVKKQQVVDWFNDLSSDWETLEVDDDNWRQSFGSPEFVGAWEQHRKMYGYTLRSELVYQMKHAIEQEADFVLEAPFRHILIDEYQDLNPCDLAVVDYIAGLGAELYVAGDDDQSIYGFRNAHPAAIRDFVPLVEGAADLRLEICMRCDPRILELADAVIRQEVGRTPKTLRSADDRAEGEVQLRQFRDQYHEAETIAGEVAQLVADGTPPKEIMILVRSDRRGAFSKVLVDKLSELELPTHVDIGAPGPLDTRDGRIMLSHLRLAVSRQDSLAWRAALKLGDNGLGEKATAAVEGVALAQGITFAAALLKSAEDALVGRFSSLVRRFVDETSAAIDELEGLFAGAAGEEESSEEIVEKLNAMPVPDWVSDDDDFRAAIRDIGSAIESAAAESLEEAVRAIGATRNDAESVIDDAAVNILSMHKAKGLEADVVFLGAAEDEYMPGRAEADTEISGERRLLYVSLTRARHRLLISYCNRRIHAQQRTGRTAGAQKRTLSRFLSKLPLKPVLHD